MHRRILLRSHAAVHRRSLDGGADRLVNNVARALSESGWSVHVLCPSTTEATDLLDSVTYHEFPYPEPASAPRKLLNSARGARTFKSIVEEVRFDVVLDDVSHIPFYPAHVRTPDATTNAVFLHTAFFDDARRFSGLFRGTAVSLIDRTLPLLGNPHIVCAGPSTESRVEDRLGYSRTSVLRPCIGLDSFTYNFDVDANTVLCLGRLSRRKNVRCLLDAWAHVEDTHPEYDLVVAGTGPREESLKRRARRLGLEHVRFTGFVSESEKRRLYRDALLFVLPSLMEGYVTTGLEALASGTPVVGADAPGINDYVEDGVNGFLFDTDESHVLANVLQSALSEPDVLEPLARTGRSLAEDHSYEAFKRRADSLFETIADSN